MQPRHTVHPEHDLLLARLSLLGADRDFRPELAECYCGSKTHRISYEPFQGVWEVSCGDGCGLCAEGGNINEVIAAWNWLVGWLCSGRTVSRGRRDAQERGSGGAP